jgi:hypothetical protein
LFPFSIPEVLQEFLHLLFLVLEGSPIHVKVVSIFFELFFEFSFFSVEIFVLLVDVGGDFGLGLQFGQLDF